MIHSFISYCTTHPWDALGKFSLGAAIIGGGLGRVAQRTGWKWASVAGGVLTDLGNNLVGAALRFRGPRL